MHQLTDEDAERVKDGFQRMAADIEQWPAPATLMRYLPEKPRPYFHALAAPEQTPEEIEAERARRRAIIDANMDKLPRDFKRTDEP